MEQQQIVTNIMLEAKKVAGFNDKVFIQKKVCGMKRDAYVLETYGVITRKQYKAISRTLYKIYQNAQ